MKKNLLPIITIVAMLFLGACSNEDIVQETNTNTPESARVLSLTASMPADDATTRVALEENADKSIDLAWEVNDEIKFAFVQGATTLNATSKVTSISNGGKTAQFAVSLPEGINNTEEFTLFGVYGGGVVSGTDVTLPANPGNTTSLANIDLMLYFKQIVTPGEELAVTFNHLGSLFSINLKNTHSSQLSYTGIEFRLVGVGGDAKWAYNNAEGGQAFDLATEKFKNTETAGNFISFKVPNSTVVPAGGIIKLWGWYPTLANKNWPELKLELLNNGAPHKEGSNFKAARTSPTAVGRNFSFYVVYNGAAYKFSDESFTPFITQKEVVLDVPTMGTLETLLAEYDKAYIEKLTLTGEVDHTDFEFMKTQMPNLTYLDMQGVGSCFGYHVKNEKIMENYITDYAFGNYATASATASKPHNKLETVILPNSIKTIGRDAFANCESLTNVEFNEGLVEIGYYSFANTPIAGVLNTPATLARIEGFAFLDCIDITSLVLGNNVAKVAQYAFNGSGLVGKVVFPSKLGNIGDEAFNNVSEDLVFRFARKGKYTPVYKENMLQKGTKIEVPTGATADYEAENYNLRHKIIEY